MNVTGNTLTNVETGILVQNGGTATILGNQINGSTTGIQFSTGGGGSVTGNDFDDTADNGTDLLLTATAGAVTSVASNTFAGDTFYIDNQSTQDIDATTNTFDEASNFRIEDKIHHEMDTDLSIGNGLVTWVSGNLYVTDAGTDHSIQRGVDVATAGDTVNVEAGLYVENVSINKSLTLKSDAGRASTTIQGVSGVGALWHAADRE